MVQWSEPLLGMPTSQMEVLVLNLAAPLLIQPPANAPERQQTMARVLGSLPLTWETWMVFLALALLFF